MTTSITLIHSVKNSPEDWFDNYKQIQEYWSKGKLDDRLRALRNYENRIFVDLSVHGINTLLGNCMNMERNYTYLIRTKKEFDLNVFARNVETAFIMVCAVDLYLDSMEKLNGHGTV